MLELTRLGLGSNANCKCHYPQEKYNTPIPRFERGNGIGQVGGLEFGKSIGANHPSMTYLNLKDNMIDSVAGISIGKGLRLNATLTVLDLSKNMLYDEGASAISRALSDAQNTTGLIGLEPWV